jgi:DNA invertase Pin-like site-specific DNA recombinase
LVLAVLSLNAQLERENILQRQTEGIAAAKAKGVVFGRVPVVVPCNFNDICWQWRNKLISVKQAAKMCGFSVRTLYNLTKEWRKKEGKL